METAWKRNRIRKHVTGKMARNVALVIPADFLLDCFFFYRFLYQADANVFFYWIFLFLASYRSDSKPIPISINSDLFYTSTHMDLTAPIPPWPFWSSRFSTPDAQPPLHTVLRLFPPNFFCYGLWYDLRVALIGHNWADQTLMFFKETKI